MNHWPSGWVPNRSIRSNLESVQCETCVMWDNLDIQWAPFIVVTSGPALNGHNKLRFLLIFKHLPNIFAALAKICISYYSLLSLWQPWMTLRSIKYISLLIIKFLATFMKHNDINSDFKQVFWTFFPEQQVQQEQQLLSLVDLHWRGR